jgi:hypothetical protein
MYASRGFEPVRHYCRLLPISVGGPLTIPLPIFRVTVPPISASSSRSSDGVGGGNNDLTSLLAPGVVGSTLSTGWPGPARWRWLGHSDRFHENRVKPSVLGSRQPLTRSGLHRSQPARRSSQPKPASVLGGEHGEPGSTPYKCLMPFHFPTQSVCLDRGVGGEQAGRRRKWGSGVVIVDRQIDFYKDER